MLNSLNITRGIKKFASRYVRLKNFSKSTTSKLYFSYTRRSLKRMWRNCNLWPQCWTDVIWSATAYSTNTNTSIQQSAAGFTNARPPEYVIL